MINKLEPMLKIRNYDSYPSYSKVADKLYTGPKKYLINRSSRGIGSKEMIFII